MQGTLDDLTQGAVVLHIVRVQGGGWYMNEDKSCHALLMRTLKCAAAIPLRTDRTLARIYALQL